MQTLLVKKFRNKELFKLFLQKTDSWFTAKSCPIVKWAEECGVVDPLVADRYMIADGGGITLAKWQNQFSKIWCRKFTQRSHPPGHALLALEITEQFLEMVETRKQNRIAKGLNQRRAPTATPNPATASYAVA